MINNTITWNSIEGNKPLAVTAIHNGNLLRKDIAEKMLISKIERLREEDPFTGELTSIGETRIIANYSRFQVDFNRPRNKAIYIKPEDAWGLNVWNEKPTCEIIESSLREYDAFYAEAKRIFSKMEENFGYFVVFDLHSYNHLREGRDGLPADPELNPEVNIGTGTVNKEIWAPLVNRFISDLKNYNYFGRSLDVRENIKFKGGQFSKWIHETFPQSGCSLSIEFKKFFMDEWSGIPDLAQLQEIRMALESTVPGVLEELKKLGAKW
ncbi:MAG: N-formylglutamate amidohydrolase [Bacteroidetes bacterium]|nr:N-formylglutamate amidohydrolase [Bacteroidota bacterium]MBU1116759.1 N-formylglutamate amidohydrolase [Bacteroidota bacterium]MBU1798852.1 N-formylglutamate amidohydrolase [Bacteroidota bacterium]